MAAFLDLQQGMAAFPDPPAFHEVLCRLRRRFVTGPRPLATGLRAVRVFTGQCHRIIEVPSTRASVFPRTEIDSALVALRIIRRAPAGLAIGITTASTGAGGRSTIGIPTTIRRGRDTDTPTSSIPDSTTGATPILAIPAALKTTAPDTPVLETATLDTTPLHTIRAAPLRLIRLPTRTRAFARPISRPRLQRR